MIMTYDTSLCDSCKLSVMCKNLSDLKQKQSDLKNQTQFVFLIKDCEFYSNKNNKQIMKPRGVETFTSPLNILEKTRKLKELTPKENIRFPEEDKNAKECFICKTESDETPIFICEECGKSVCEDCGVEDINIGKFLCKNCYDKQQ